MGEPARHPRGMLPAGTRVGRYELVRRLAKGGMAELYLARAHGIHGFEKLVVLKLVLPYLAEDREFVDMFLHEARLAATLDHPNIVHVTDIGEVQGEPFFVMEYVHGQDVRAILRAAATADKPMPLACALTIAAGVATGLHYVHDRRGSDGRFLGLVHRDVSPANVVVSYGGGVKLVDFGIAKATELRNATRSGVLKGKVNYMAPEQCHGLHVDRRTDVFALGILLYEMTTGKRLFAGDSDFYVMSRIVRGMFAKPTEVDPKYPPALEAIILRALSADPDDRHATAQDLLADLEAFAHEHRTSLSGLRLAEFLRDLFGEQLYPSIDETDEVSPTIVHPDTPATGAHSSMGQRVPPTAVSTTPESETTILPQTAGAIEVPPEAEPDPAAAATTRVLEPGEAPVFSSARTLRTVTAGDTSQPIATDVVESGLTEPSPKVNVAPGLLVPPAAGGTVPTPIVSLSEPPSIPRTNRRLVGIAVGLGVAAVLAFMIGMSAGTRAKKSSASPDPAPSSQSSDDSASIARQPASPTDRVQQEREPVITISSPPVEPEVLDIELDHEPAAKPTPPVKKKRPRSKSSAGKSSSNLDAMYPSTSRPRPSE